MTMRKVTFPLSSTVDFFFKKKPKQIKKVTLTLNDISKSCKMCYNMLESSDVSAIVNSAVI